MENSEFLKNLIKESVDNRDNIIKGLVYPKDAAFDNPKARAINISDLPDNFFNQETFVEYVLALGEKYDGKIDVKVLEDEELKELNAGGILGVNQGSECGAKLLVLKYENSDGPLTGLVGKAVMFDAGGYHIKSFESMDGMKYDMCGGANVIAVVENLAATNAVANVCAVVPVVENLINSNALRMGDCIRMMSGNTVEVVFTDAEGRLILADALTYAKSIGCDRIIDMATLTYSIIRSLGSVYTGAFSNDDDFLEELLKTAKANNEKVWHMPLDDEYTKKLDYSVVADFCNYKMNEVAEASIAAGFLSRFVGDTPWIHLDICATATKETDGKTHATGVLIDTLTEFCKE